MILHENKELYIQAIKATSDFIGIEEFLIEKYYWVRTNGVKSCS